MRPLCAITLATGCGWLGLTSIASVQAATLVENFEIVVDRVNEIPPFLQVPASAVPLIKTRGQGRLTFDTNLIQFNPTQNFLPVGYLVTQPTSLSIDFFGQRYTQLPVSAFRPDRQSPRFIFDRTESGGYQLSSFEFSVFSNQGYPLLVGETGFFYTVPPAPGILVASGTTTLTDSEVIPEPSTIAGVPVAIALWWACNRRFKRRSK